MNNRVQLIQPAFFEGHLGQSRPIQPAVCTHNLTSEDAHNLVIDSVLRLHQGAPQRVRLNHLRAQSAQKARNRALPAPQAPVSPTLSIYASVPSS